MAEFKEGSQVYRVATAGLGDTLFKTIQASKVVRKTHANVWLVLQTRRGMRLERRIRIDQANKVWFDTKIEAIENEIKKRNRPGTLELVGHLLTKEHFKRIHIEMMKERKRHIDELKDEMENLRSVLGKKLRGELNAP